MFLGTTANAVAGRVVGFTFLPMVGVPAFAIDSAVISVVLANQDKG
jgi:hypothetical protein